MRLNDFSNLVGGLVETRPRFSYILVLAFFFREYCDDRWEKEAGKASSKSFLSQSQNADVHRLLLTETVARRYTPWGILLFLSAVF